MEPACGPKKEDKNSSLADGVSRSNFNANYTIEQWCEDKRNLATPDGRDEKTSACQRQKKPNCTVKVNTAAKEKTELGVFYLKNAPINPFDIFSKDMPIRFVPTLLVMERSATMPLVTLFILRGLQSSRGRLFWQSLVISPKKTLVGSMSITSWRCPISPTRSRTFSGILKVPTVRWLDWFDCYIPMQQIIGFQQICKIVFPSSWLAGMDPASPPKLVCPIQAVPFSFEQVLSE